MANRSNNIWAKAAAGSPGTNIARAQQSRWTGIPNEAIMRLVEDKIGGMLEGISDATERNAAPRAWFCNKWHGSYCLKGQRGLRGLTRAS